MTRRPRGVVAGLFLLVLLGGCGSDGQHAVPAPPPPGPVIERVHPRGFHSTRELVGVPEPDRLRIPAIGVDTGLDRVHRKADGTLQVPPRWLVAGWYQEGPRPGEDGPAASLGHVDSTDGPAVFARLHELRPSDEVLVDAGTRTERFRVTGTQEVRKDRFPTEQVYLPTLEPVLRLITCGGAFDRASGHYTDNVIVSAALVGAS
jgi:sortase (surface protein transpeptidase)